MYIQIQTPGKRREIQFLPYLLAADEKVEASVPVNNDDDVKNEIKNAD